MRVLSLFDGMGGARLALDSLGIVPEVYYASEVDKFAMKVSNENFPDIEQVGKVESVKTSTIGRNIDLLIGGSPCTNLSCAGDNKGLAGVQSALFFEYVRLLREVKPTYFLLENVASMSNENRDKMSTLMGCQPIKINSALFTAQNRNRYYWTNIPQANNLPHPDTAEILSDILCSISEAHNLFLSEAEVAFMDRGTSKGRIHWDFNYHSDSWKNKSSCMMANWSRGIPYNVIADRRFAFAKLKMSKQVKFCDCLLRKFHPTECELLQGVPLGYTKNVSNTQRYKMLGNGFTIPVIAHLLQGLK